MTDETDSGLRGALKEVRREREAVEDMFKEDTGADTVSIDQGPLSTTVTLTYRQQSELAVPEDE